MTGRWQIVLFRLIVEIIIFLIVILLVIKIGFVVNLFFVSLVLKLITRVLKVSIIKGRFCIEVLCFAVGAIIFIIIKIVFNIRLRSDRCIV